MMKDKEHQAVTGVCCQWRGNASYDSDVHIETFVLHKKFSGEIATEQQPPDVMGNTNWTRVKKWNRYFS
jgi:hypothetical protein